MDLYTVIVILIEVILELYKIVKKLVTPREHKNFILQGL